MPEVTLTVTKKVLDYAAGAHENERQIAYRQPSADIATRLGEVGVKNPPTVRS